MEGKGEEVIDDDDDDDDFTLSFQCRQTDRPFFALLFLPFLFHLLNDNKIYTLCTRSGGLQQEE